MLDRKVFTPVRAVEDSPEYQRYLSWLAACEGAYSRDETLFLEMYNNPVIGQVEARGVQELALVLERCYRGFIETANQSYVLSVQFHPFCERCRYERAVSVFCGHLGVAVCTIDSVLSELSEDQRRRVCHLTHAITQTKYHWWQLITNEHAIQLLRPVSQCVRHDILDGCI
jgi:hypothetical protein